MKHGSTVLSLTEAMPQGSANLDLALRGLILLAQFHGVAADVRN